MNELPTFDLLQHAVGKSLKKAIAELGCPELPSGLLKAEQRAFLHMHIDDLPSDGDELNRKVIGLLLGADVIRGGVSPEGHSLLTVRITLNRVACVLTLDYYQDQWSLDQIEGVQTQLRRVSRVLVGALMGAVVTGVTAFFLLGGSGSGNIVAEAKSQGYIVLTQAQYEEQLLHPTAPTDSATPQKTKTDATDAKQGEALTFSMKEGMSTYDLTSFLKENGLIDDQAAFNQILIDRGIDTQIRPQDYSFKKGMSQEELLAVLKG
ncbi:MAG: hypothetical protein WCC10_03595 [Tumebacillaceae bacterium]